MKAYISDIGEGSPRGHEHIIADKNDFKLITLTEKMGGEKIQEYNLENKKFIQVTSDFKQLWG